MQRIILLNNVSKHAAALYRYLKPAGDRSSETLEPAYDSDKVQVTLADRAIFDHTAAYPDILQMDMFKILFRVLNVLFDLYIAVAVKIRISRVVIQPDKRMVEFLEYRQALPGGMYDIAGALDLSLRSTFLRQH
jgi:hypothetical protein